jgi:hypothetical protein
LTGFVSPQRITDWLNNNRFAPEFLLAVPNKSNLGDMGTAQQILYHKTPPAGMRRPQPWIAQHARFAGVTHCNIHLQAALRR